MHIDMTKTGHMYHVYIDGELELLWTEADDEAGWAKCYAQHRLPDAPQGFQRHRLLTEFRDGKECPVEVIRHGRIEIVLLERIASRQARSSREPHLLAASSACGANEGEDGFA